MAHRKHLSFALIVLSLAATACGDDSSEGSDGGSATDTDSGASGSSGSGGGGGGAGSGGTGGGTTKVEPLGLSDKTFLIGAMTDDAALAHLAGTYEVAIYKTPVGKESDLGAATLELSIDGNDKTLTLRDAGGDVLAEVTGSGQFTKVIGMLLVDQADAPITRIGLQFRYENRLSEAVNFDGLLTGYAGEPQSDGSYMFRNHITHYGVKPPDSLNDVIGTWSGPQLALSCERPDVTVVVEAAGKVTNSGTANLECSANEITNTWDGQDDYVAPIHFDAENPGLEVQLDTQKGGGSQLEGGIQLLVSMKEPRVIQSVKSVLSGSKGNIEAQFPAKQ